MLSTFESAYHTSFLMLCTSFSCRPTIKPRPSLADRNAGATIGTVVAAQGPNEEGGMAKKNEEGVYRIVDVVGVSETSWEDAGRQAIKTASKSLRDLRIAEVVKMDMKVENGKVVAFRTRVALSFKYES
jgi:flavin-binding protein dodecin